MSFPRYPKYRETRAEWLGQVPDHWNVTPLKYVVSLKSGGTPSKANVDYWDGAVPWASSKDLKAEVLADTQDHVTQIAVDEGAAELVPAGTLLVVVRGMILIHTFPVVKALVPMAINQDLKALTPRKNLDVDFLSWLLRGASRESLGRTDEAAHGTTVLRMEAWTSMQLPIPPLTEQTTIAAFLNRETAKIDALVAEQQRLIELLTEKRQAAISQAVTKGLNPHVPMTDSGIEWLGKVPAHWRTVPLKHLCSLLKDGTHLPPQRVDEGIPLLSVRNLEDGKFRLRDDDSKISVEDYGFLCRAFIPQADDVLLAIVGATMGKTAVIPDGLGEFHIQRSVAILRTKPLELNHRFLNLILQSDQFNALLWQQVGFSAQPGIYLGTLQNFRVPVPPSKEQSEIVRELEAVTAEHSNLMAEAEHAIDLLQEHRTALISAAVTGQIDVRQLEEKQVAA